VDVFGSDVLAEQSLVFAFDDDRLGIVGGHA
jgi:hypothetical protein